MPPSRQRPGGSGTEPARHRGTGGGGPPRLQARPGAVPRLGSRDLRREVVDQLRQALRGLRPRPVRRDRARRGTARPAIRPGAGTGLRKRILPAQPDSGRRRPARLGDRSVAWHGQGGHPQRREPRPGDRRPGRRRGGHSLRRRHLRPRGRARGAAPHPRRRAVAARGRAGAQAGWPVRVRRRADDGRQHLCADAVDG